MPIAHLIKQGLAPTLTPQQIADLALAEDQAARRANRHYLGGLIASIGHIAERDALCSLMPKP